MISGPLVHVMVDTGKIYALSYKRCMACQEQFMNTIYSLLIICAEDKQIWQIRRWSLIQNFRRFFFVILYKQLIDIRLA